MTSRSRELTAAERERFLRIDAIFDAALDLEPNDRADYVARACADDDALRGRVQLLLDAHARSSGFLGSPAIDLAGVLLDDPMPGSDHAESLRAGPFRIVRELGHGGMGVVYLAEREGAEFQQRVALKLVRHLGATDAVRRRFVEERRILALLEHPNIAHLIDGGLTTEGLPYFAMELVEGEPIDTYCSSRHLSIDQRIDLFVEVCEAVQYAHEHLVIHRDLKPSNILVRADGQLKLLDFGIAKLLDPLRSGDEAGATQTGLIALTPEYAAPEQIRGQTVSTATDAYALGVLLYRLLAGQRPYEVRGLTPAELERIVCELEPPRPSTLAPERSKRALGGDLDMIIMKALHKDPARRYSSAAALRDDLRRHRTGLPVLARPESRAYRLGKFVRRNRTVVSALSVTGVALMGATAFSAAQMREAQRQRDAAVQEAARQTALAEVQAVLGSDLRDAAGKPLAPAERIALGEQVLVQEFADKPWLVVEGRQELSAKLYEMGEREAERAMLARASALAQSAHLPTQLAIADCRRAYSLTFDDQLDSARAVLATARAALATPGASLPVAEAMCVDAEGQLLVAEGRTDSAIVMLQRAVDLSQGERDRPFRLQAMMDLSLAVRSAGRTRDAAEIQRRVIASLDAAGFRGTAVMLNVMTFITGSLFELGELASVDSLSRAVIRAQASVPGSHSTAYLTFAVGVAALRSDALDTAQVWLRQAMAVDTSEDAGGLSAYLPPAITQLRLEQGRAAEARASLARLPSGTLQRRVSRAWFTSWTRYAEGDTRGAITMLEDSLRVIRGKADKLPPILAVPFTMAAEWRLAAGDARAADSLALLGRAAAAIDSLALQRSAYVGRAELVRARARRALGDAVAARDAADRAIVAMTIGYGPVNWHTQAAKAFRSSFR